jgi:hypothetical protein
LDFAVCATRGFTRTRMIAAGNHPLARFMFASAWVVTVRY